MQLLNVEQYIIYQLLFFYINVLIIIVIPYNNYHKSEINFTIRALMVCIAVYRYLYQRPIMIAVIILFTMKRKLPELL